MRTKSEKTRCEIISAIDGYFFEHKRAPSINEISTLVGHSKSTVHGYLKDLNESGRIVYDGTILETEAMRKADHAYTLAPILGAVACGAPQYEEENYEAYVALPEALFGKGEHFVLEAKGESMVEAGIAPGDYVVVRKQSTAEEGDIVVALVDNETTLKRFFRDEAHKCIRLHPENKHLADIFVEKCYIQGVARHVIKKLE